MSEPLKAGDLAEVVDGMLGRDSPNLGLIVRVLSCVGEHSQLGRIWRCEAEYAILAPGRKERVPGTAEFAQSWLRKIEPPGDQDKTSDKADTGKELNRETI